MPDAWHVVPINDLREHVESADCWCCPDIRESGDVIVHHAMDRREEYETGRQRAN